MENQVELEFMIVDVTTWAAVLFGTFAGVYMFISGMVA
jgi:hypothetical protein